MSFRIFLLLVLLVSYGFFSCSEDSISSSTHKQELPEILSAVSKESSLPGFSVSVIKNGEIDFRVSYGMANSEDEILYSSQTVQPVASVSKAILGVAVAKAIELGFFTLETNINDILPFNVVNPNHPSTPIKVKHLVTHTSGLIDDRELFFATYSILPGEDISTYVARMMLNDFNMSDDEVLSMAYVLQAYFSTSGDFYDASHFSADSPGTSYSYSNFAASLAAYLIEIKSGQQYKGFVANHIFAPLGMNSTSYMYEGSVNPELYASLYFQEGSPYPKYTSACYPSGEITTSNEDLTLFLMEMMKGFQGNGAILNANSYDLLFDKLYSGDGISSADHSMFWFLEDGLIYHAGTDLGTIAKIEFNTTTNSGFVFMSNAEIQLSGEAADNLQNVNTILFALKDYAYKN